MKEIGKTAIMYALADEDMEKQIKEAEKQGFILLKGRVGSMNTEKIFAAVETAAARENIVRRITTGTPMPFTMPSGCLRGHLPGPAGAREHAHAWD